MLPSPSRCAWAAPRGHTCLQKPSRQTQNPANCPFTTSQFVVLQDGPGLIFYKFIAENNLSHSSFFLILVCHLALFSTCLTWKSSKEQRWCRRSRHHIQASWKSKRYLKCTFSLVRSMHLTCFRIKLCKGNDYIHSGAKSIQSLFTLIN